MVENQTYREASRQAKRNAPKIDRRPADHEFWKIAGPLLLILGAGMTIIATLIYFLWDKQ